MYMGSIHVCLLIFAKLTIIVAEIQSRHTSRPGSITVNSNLIIAYLNFCLLLLGPTHAYSRQPVHVGLLCLQYNAIEHL